MCFFRQLTLAALSFFLVPAGVVSSAHASSGGEMQVSTSGNLPVEGRVVIRSGLAWLTEEDSLFSSVGLALAEKLTARGLAVVVAPPSQKAPLPEGTEAIRRTSLPSNKGMRQRIMSVAEAVSRMKAMQLAREGRLPRARSGNPEKGKAGEARLRMPALTHPELIRFAISQEQALPALRGQITIPGRLPDEIRTRDHTIADYALVAEFVMLWPAAGSPDVPSMSDVGRGLAVGWHLLELACYDLAPARKNKAPIRCWNCTVQRVAYGAYLWSSLPEMVRAALDDKK